MDKATTDKVMADIKTIEDSFYKVLGQRNLYRAALEAILSDKLYLATDKNALIAIRTIARVALRSGKVDNGPA